MEQTKDVRIKREVRSLKRLYRDIPQDHKASAERIIARAAYQKVTLEDLESDLDQNGWTELFQQSVNVEPYDRKRPNADLYIQISAQYLRSMKQLDSMLPKTSGATATNDELLAFLDSDK